MKRNEVHDRVISCRSELLQKIVCKSCTTASEEHEQNCCRLAGLTDFDRFAVGILQTMPVGMHQRQFKASFLKAVIGAKTCQDKSAGMNSRRYLRPLYSNVLHTFPYHLHGSAKGIRDKCCLCLSRCKNRNAACVVFKHENISKRSTTLCS